MIPNIDITGFASAIRELRAVQKPPGNSPLQDAAMESARKSTSASAASGDMLLLSPSAKQLTDFFATQETPDSENDDVDLEGMKLRSDMLAESLQMQLGAFQNKMVGILGSAGMDATTPFTLQADSHSATSATTGAASAAAGKLDWPAKQQSGAIRVTNGHPDAAGIEALMRNMPGLSKDIHEIASLASVVRANHLNPRASEMNGGLNPLSIAAQYAKNTGERFNLRLGTNDASWFFN